VDCDNKMLLIHGFFFSGLGGHYLDSIQLLYHLHTPMMMHLKRVWKRKALLCALVRLIFVKNCCEFSTIQKGLEM